MKSGSVTGPNAPENDLMTNIINFSKKTRTVPEISVWGGHLNFVTVEEVARTLVSELLSANARQIVSYVHSAGKTITSMRDLTELIGLEKDTADEIQTLTFESWVDTLAKTGMNPLLVTYLQRVGNRALGYF
jgi:hybrid polyketide synthase/nonribosomal peptide synthetase ACE1